MSEGAITFSTALDNDDLERDLGRLKKKIEGLEEKLFKQKQGRLPLQDQLEGVALELDKAKAKLDGMQSGDKFFTKASIAAQAEEVKQLQAEFDKAAGAVERCDSKIRESNVDIDLQKTKAGAVAEQLAAASSASNLMGGAIKRAEKHLDTFKSRLASVVRSALIFTVITQSLTKFRDWMGKVIETNAEASAAMARLKGALLTMAQPLVNVIIPAFVAFVNVLTQIITAIARVVSALFGMTVEQSAKAAEALDKETSAIKKTGAAAKKAEGQLASFDEANKLSDNSSNSGGADSGAAIKPDFSLFNTAEYKSKIDELTAYVSGALLALGAILAFSGINIPLGLALMAAGAIGLASVIATNWGAMDDGLRGALTYVSTVIGGFALVIGAILAFSGVNIPLGIGLMAAGVVGLASAVALNWGTISQELQGPLGQVVALVSECLLAIGIILVMSGVALPLGIALIAAGAIGLATTAALNWDTIIAALQGPLGETVALASAAMLALGLMLAFSGVALPLGIALIAAGAVGLATVTALNWSAIMTALQGPLGETVALISGFLLALGVVLALSGVALPLGIALIAAGAAGLVTVVALNWQSITAALQGPLGETVALASGALLALGIILCLSGVGLPLGIALIAAGAVGLVTVTALNWNAILDKLKEVWKNISSWWSTNVAPKFTLQYWKDVFGAIKDGLVAKIKDAVNGGIALFNQFIDWLNRKLNISWGSFSLFGKEIIPAGSFQLLTLPRIPMLAEGAVIPPNREFMAVLGDQKNGTNIETPEGLLRQIFREESGNSAIVSELREILRAIREGRVMMVDKKVLGELTRDSLASAARAGGMSSVPVR